MTLKEYFGDWLDFIPQKEFKDIYNIISKIDDKDICPNKADVFKPFTLCSPNDVKVVLIGQDPYSQKSRATGIPFGNPLTISDDKLSASLQIIKDSVINFERRHNIITFDNSLESWGRQGVLMLNSALTCYTNRTGSMMMQWRPFMSHFLENLSNKYTGLVYILFGEVAQSFTPYIKRQNLILKEKHPAYYARTKTKMPNKVFEETNRYLEEYYGESPIKWFDEEQLIMNYDLEYEEVLFD